LDTSVDAVRKRIQRGTLDSEKDEDGRVYVWLDISLEGESEALISELRDRVDFLQRELERKDAILLNMTEALKAISPPEARESPETPSEPRPSTTEAPEAETPAEGRPWWRRVFGG
jgi:hypothetical protein